MTRKKTTDRRSGNGTYLKIYQLALRRLAAVHPNEFKLYQEEIKAELEAEEQQGG